MIEINKEQDFVTYDVDDGYLRANKTLHCSVK